MKKVLSLVLALILAVGTLTPSVSVYAENEEPAHYTQRELDYISANYQDLAYMMESLFYHDDAIAYWNVVHQIRNDKWDNWQMKIGALTIGEKLDKKQYIQFLANLMTLQTYDLARQIETQEEFDDLKSGIDYTLDVIDIAIGFAGGASETVEQFSPVLDTLIKGGKMSADSLKYFHTLMGDYCKSRDFLDALRTYAISDTLRDAAAEMYMQNEKLLYKRLDSLVNTMEKGAKYEAKFFMDNLFFPVAKSFFEDSDPLWSEVTDSCEKVWKLVKGYGGLAFSITMLMGDTCFGTTNTFRRYNEMCAMADIAEALVLAGSKIQIPENLETDEDLARVKQKTDYDQMLLSVHARGEYLVYKLLTSDAGVLSLIQKHFEKGKKEEDTTEGWYQSQKEVILRYNQRIEDLFSLDDMPVEMGMLVSDAYTKECTYTLRDNTKCTSVYRIPKINSNSDKIKKINEKIYNTLYPKIETCVSEIAEVGWPLSGRNITYQWAVNGDILSIVVQQSEKVPHGGTDYYVYNISVSDNENVSREKVFSTAGLSSDGFYDVVKSAIEKAYPKIFGPDTGSIVIDKVSILEQSVAHENIDLSQPYINDKGNLHVIVPLYCPAGPTYLYYDIQCTGDEEAENTTENTKDTTAYTPVLNLYHHGISNHWQDDISEGWNEIVNWAQPGVGEHGGCAMIERSFHTDSALTEIGYLLVDLNQDGQDELIISPLEDGKNGMIYDLYTVSDGKIVRLIVSDERSRAYLTAGNTITMEASGGWNVSISKIYYLKDADLCIRESLRYDGVEDESNPWFYAKADGTITKDQSENLKYEHISEEEFNTKMNQLPSKDSLTLTPFEQYQPS